jgi:hypothetical protein
VREAIAASKGSRSMAQQLLLHWAEEDPKLLMGMAQPFMKAIITAAMQGEMRRLDARSAAASRGGGAGGHLSRDALSQVISRLGDAPPRQAAPASAAGGAAGGMRSATMTVASKAEAAAKSGDVDHQKAMMAIAKAFAVKKF